MSYNSTASCKRSFAIYAQHVHGVSDKMILLEWFEALRGKFQSDLDFHVAIVEAYRNNFKINKNNA